jgi:hypothetical protein
LFFQLLTGIFSTICAVSELVLEVALPYHTKRAIIYASDTQAAFLATGLVLRAPGTVDTAIGNIAITRVY